MRCGSCVRTLHDGGKRALDRKLLSRNHREGVQLLSDELSEVSDNLELTVQFLSDDFAAVSELSGKNLR